MADLRTGVKRKLRQTARGPFRTALRTAQARSSLLAGGRKPGPPDFVGIGVQRAGTSWWHSIIETHPLVDGLGWTAKELHFFDDRWDAELTDADIDAYEANFLRRSGHLAGEWTPRYLADPWAVPLLHRAAPDARLLVLLRDPVERFRSGLGHATERLGGVTPDVVADAIVRGRYATQLRRVFDVVPREQVLVLQFERCRAETQVLADRTFAFLGLDPVPLTDDLHRGSNASSAKQDLPGWLLDELVAGYRDEVEALDELVPGEIDRALWRNFT